ncbi:hypothetical protein HPP92_014842 [Vanilla planifolia]|uniref:Transmembrane protein n=1 Tax=Vanilla planifolia TaxID=51239 RepID=A0A835QGS0_VANPL|nr:hypothetical protein HPP92_014842 [Vanilla planifolia]
MATYKELKKLWKNTKQGLLGFSLYKACGVVLAAFFLVSTFHFPLTKVVILLQPNPLLLFNASSSCTSASDIDPKAAPLSPSPPPTEVGKTPPREIDGALKGRKGGGRDQFL